MLAEFAPMRATQLRNVSSGASNSVGIAIKPSRHPSMDQFCICAAGLNALQPIYCE